MPHPAKKAKGGEDAASITDNIVIVADGVGGWADSGVDPAKFPRMLMSNMDKRIAREVDDEYIEDPTRLLIDAMEETREKGSSTCVILTLDKHYPFLRTSNIGDSAYLLLRKSGADLVSIFRSKEQ